MAEQVGRWIGRLLTVVIFWLSWDSLPIMRSFAILGCLGLELSAWVMRKRRLDVEEFSRLMDRISGQKQR